MIRAIPDSVGNLQGVLVFSLDSHHLGGQLLSKQRTLYGQTSVIYDSSFHIVYQDNAISKDLEEEISARYTAGNRSFTVRNTEGKNIFCVTQYNGLTHWITVSFIKEENLFSDAKQLREFIGSLIVLCILLAGLVLCLLSKALSTPIRRLNEAMKQVQYQHLDIRLPIERGDEIGELTESFNYMMQRIDKLICRVYDEKIAQKTAEIEALQAQINPHFLYNTLDSINWMLIERDEMEISSVLISLGKLMQYSMDTSRPFVTIREEYNHVLNYLTIQKNRLEDRLEYELTIQSEAEDFLIPKLILQPLIENAIKHGILPSGRHGRIYVRTTLEKSQIIICVEDNGCGMNPQQLQEFRALLSGEKKGAETIGICNVARRLQLHFDDDCKFLVMSTVGQGTVIQLSIPIFRRRETSESYYCG